MVFKTPEITKGLSRRLAEFSVSLSLDRVPPAALNNAKMAVLDCLGVAVLAVRHEVGSILLRFARSELSTGPCTIWGSSFRANARDAALINGALAHGLDYDDRAHASTYSLAASLAMAESLGRPGALLLEAFIVGREVRMALDQLFSKRSAGHGPGARGWHSNGILGPIASACAAAKVTGLAMNDTLAAIGLAAGSCGALTRDGGTMAKPLRAGQAASAGVTAALLAREGFTSDDAALEGPFGLLQALGPLEEGIVESLGHHLGRHFDLSERGVQIKSLASCSATHAAVEAMLKLAARRPLRPAEIEFIECDLRLYPLVRIHPSRGFEGRFSMPFCLAVALLFQRLAPDDFTDQRLRHPEVQSIMARIRHCDQSKELVISLQNGTRLVEPVVSRSCLESSDEIERKFESCVRGILSDQLVPAMIDTVKHVETLGDIRSLTRLLEAANPSTPHRHV